MLYYHITLKSQHYISMELLLFLFVICFNVSTLLIWFKSDAFIEWMNLFGLGKFIKYQEYLDTKLDNFNITYPLFLKLKYPLFIFKLIGCPFCSNVWLSIMGSAVISLIRSEGNPFLFIIQTIIHVPIILVLSTYIYGVLSKQFNENK